MEHAEVAAFACYRVFTNDDRDGEADRERRELLLLSHTTTLTGFSLQECSQATRRRDQAAMHNMCTFYLNHSMIASPLPILPRLAADSRPMEAPGLPRAEH